MYFCSFVDPSCDNDVVSFEKVHRSRLLFSENSNEFIVSFNAKVIAFQHNTGMVEIFKLVQHTTFLIFFVRFTLSHNNIPNIVSYDLFLDSSVDRLLSNGVMPCEKIFSQLLLTWRSMLYFDPTFYHQMHGDLAKNMRLQENNNIRRNQVQLNDAGWQRSHRLTEKDNAKVNLMVRSCNANVLHSLPVGKTHMYNIAYNVLHRRKQDALGTTIETHGGIFLGPRRDVSVLAAVMLSKDVSKPPQVGSFVESFYVPCTSTLLVVPNHLVGCWMNSVKKYTGDSLVVLQLRQHKDFKKQTIGEIASADLVICSENMFNCYNDSSGWDAVNWTRQRTCLQRDPTYYDNPVSNIALNFFHWCRVIFDQFHSLTHLLLNEVTAQNILTHRGVWFLSSNFILPIRQLREAMTRFCIKENIDIANTFVNSTIVSRLPVPPTRMTTKHSVSLTEAERERYVSLIHMFKDSEVILQQLSGFGKSNVGNKHIRVIQKFSDIYEWARDRYTVKMARATSEVSLQHLGRQHQHLQQQILRIASAEQRHSSSEEKCNICYNTNISCITICGHCFCWQCLFKSLQRNESCPMCRSPILYGDACEIQHNSSFRTRQTHVLNTICNLAEVGGQRVVVVAEHQWALQECRRLLLERNVTSRRMYGSVRTCQLSYENFSDKKTNILLLPIKKMNGLLSLNFDHVVFLYAPRGDVNLNEFLDQNENVNAVNIHFFETEDTVENKYWQQLFT